MTPHFTLSELTRSTTADSMGLVNQPNEQQVRNLYALAGVLEQARYILGAPLRITSGYRCTQLNQVVGGAWNSAHLDGLAADFIADGLGVAKTVKLLAESCLNFDQLIEEHSASSSWVHIGLDKSWLGLGKSWRREVLLYKDGRYQRLYD